MKTILLFALLASAGPASAQIPILRWDDPTDLGYSNEPTFRQLSDIDGDGFPEILFAHRDPGAANAEYWIYSLATEQPLFILPGSSQEQTIPPNRILSATDLTNDGLRDLLLLRVDDFIVGSVEVRDGSDLSLVWNVDGPSLGDNPSMLIEIDDVTGDGMADVFVILIKPNPLFTTKQGVILSGADGSIFYTLQESFNMVSPFPLGDIDHDGFGDFGVRPSLGSNFYIYSGATGTQIQVLSGAADTTHSRNSMVPVGDINGDGLNDWAETWEQSSFPVDSSIHFFTDIFNPTEIGVFDAEFFDTSLGSTPIFAHDFDGDGMQDVVFRTQNPQGIGKDSVTLYSPANGILREWAHYLRPTPHALVEDWDGDGLPDLLLQSVVVTSQTLLVSGLREHLSLSLDQISQAGGGTLVCSIDAGPRFAGRRAQLYPADGETRPFLGFLFQIPSAPWEAAGFPFAPTILTKRIFDRRNNPALSDWNAVLDFQGQATITLDIAPGELPLSMIGRQLHFTAMIESSTPPYPETFTERVSVTVLP